MAAIEIEMATSALAVTATIARDGTGRDSGGESDGTGSGGNRDGVGVSDHDSDGTDARERRPIGLWLIQLQYDSIQRRCNNSK